ncbi:MAG: pantetheine-phosphate adenylyltransferase [Actinomycetota bacterium]
MSATSPEPSAGTPRSIRAFYPGSFDPLHLGHVDVIAQAHELFGSVTVGILFNFAKDTGMFSVDERLELTRSAVAHLPGVEVISHSGLAVDAARLAGADLVVKGLRTPADFEIEHQMSQMNHSVAGIRTVFVSADPALSFVSSRFVREIAKYGGDVSHLVPSAVAEALAAKFGQGDAT